MPDLAKQIESVLLFKNEPVSVAELAQWLGAQSEGVKSALKELQDFYRDRGVVVVFDGEEASFGTSPKLSTLIETLAKEELSRELGRAGLETLAIVLYKGPVSRREIDHIRGVNSGFILRSLLIRGLVERGDPSTALGAGRSYTYKPTLKLLEHLGLSSREELPEYSAAVSQLKDFIKHSPEENE